MDNGVKNALNLFGLLNDTNYQDKVFKLRCYSCNKMYDHHVDFCSSCGYNTITRVSVIIEDGKEKILLKNNYVYRKKKPLKDRKGVELIAADQKEYIEYLNTKKRQEKSKNKFKIFD